MKRAQQREKIVKGNRVLKEHIKARKREHMKTYRKKLKSKKDTKGSNDSEKKAGSVKKQKAVLNTQRWRMRIKLAESKNDSSSCTNKDDNNNDGTENRNDCPTEER